MQHLFRAAYSPCNGNHILVYILLKKWLSILIERANPFLNFCALIIGPNMKRYKDQQRSCQHKYNYENIVFANFFYKCRQTSTERDPIAHYSTSLLSFLLTCANSSRFCLQTLVSSNVLFPKCLHQTSN